MTGMAIFTVFWDGVVIIHFLAKDNAPVHNYHTGQMEMRTCGHDILPHPPYSLDLAPSDFHISPSMESFLKSKRVKDDTAMISGHFLASHAIWGLLQASSLQLHKTTGKCVSLGGTYVEKDK
nr:histone-lysine N-methyltransferase SETMAR-like [Penaeus vannamei]